MLFMFIKILALILASQKKKVIIDILNVTNPTQNLFIIPKNYHNLLNILESNYVKVFQWQLVNFCLSSRK